MAKDWFIKVVKVAGALTPVSAACNQLLAELESEQFKQRFDKLEDPISYLHEDVAELTKGIYEALKQQNKRNLNFSDEFYTQYRRPIAALKSQNLIDTYDLVATSIPAALMLNDASYVMYMCNLCEDQKKMEELIEIVDRCEPGVWINGDELSVSMELPTPVISAVFDIYASKGYGLVSQTMNECKYLGKA